MRSLLRFHVPGSHLRVIDSLYLLIGLVVAFVVCFPILIVTTLVSYAVFGLLGAVGLPEAVQGVAVLVFGLGGGLVLGFLALVRISRLVPSSVREVMDDHGASDGAGVSVTQDLVSAVAGDDAGFFVGLAAGFMSGLVRIVTSIRSFRAPRTAAAATITQQVSAADARLTDRRPKDDPEAAQSNTAPAADQPHPDLEP